MSFGLTEGASGMQKLMMKWLVVALTVLAVPHLVDGIAVDSFGTALALSLVLGLLNIVLKPVLIFLTLPFTLVTFGFFLLVVNALVFWISASTVSGVHIQGFAPAFFASLIVSIVTSVFSFTVKREAGRVSWKFERNGGRRTRDVNPNSPLELEKDPTGRWS